MGASIILRRQVRRNFTTVPNDIVRDPRLSWKALGLLIFMLSVPDNFRFYLAHLSSLKPTGRDGTRAGLKELEMAGYLVIRRERQAGRFSQVFWDLTDSPPGGIPQPSKSPRSENPNTVKPTAVLPNSEKPTLLRTNNKQELKKQRTTTTVNANTVSQKCPEHTDFGSNEIHWPSEVEVELRPHCKKILSACPADQKQLVLYELAGRISKLGVRSPIGLLHRIVERARSGAFVPAAALEYQRKLKLDAAAAKITADHSRKRAIPTEPGIAKAHIQEIRGALKAGEANRARRRRP